MKTSITTEMELIPFTVPSEVQVKGFVGLKQDGWKAPESIPLAELKIEVLQELCSEFVKAIYKQADKVVPNYLELNATKY